MAKTITLTLTKIIEPTVIKIASEVKTAPVKHLDETGFRIGGKTKWLHVVSTESLTWYRVADKRKDIEVLTDIKGVVVHDHWNPYYQLEDVNWILD
ncbi:IS66 family transposase [Nostoc sp.]|uniref:IS66 family transposase n=1 Tax=Nostoc sp. TaxID=1180 RepID=UPI002FF9732E